VAYRPWIGAWLRISNLREELMKSLLKMTLRSLLDDVQRLHPGVKGLDRDFKTIEARFEDEDYGFLTVALPSFGKALDRAYATGRLTCPLGFKKVPRGSLPRFLSGLTSNVFDVKTGLLLEKPCVQSITTLRQITLLMKKMQLSSDREEILDRKAREAFFTCDDSIRSLPRERLEHYRRVCNWVMPNLDGFAELDCKHGPGAVSEGYTANQKWQAVYRGLSEFDPRLMEAGYDITAIGCGIEPRFEPEPIHSSRGCARLVTVAKSSTARRTITVEPCLNMFVQQGLNTYLRDCIKKDGILSKCLTLTDQTPNQKLALEGSRTGEFATLDLSSASDLMSYELVQETFRNHPRFLSLVDLTRSAFVEGPQGPTAVRKFAGMGNALTFPIQSTVFACICIAAILWNSGTFRPRRKDLERVSRSIRVFGDDIIVPTDAYASVVDWLQHLGLKVNVEKSFATGKFRESCGVDAYDGVDITPLYLRFEPDVTSLSAQALEGIVAASNLAWSKCYYKFSDALRNVVEEFLKRELPLVGRDASCLGWTTRQNAWDSTRWNPKLHRFEIKSLCGSPQVRVDAIGEYAALLKFFHVPLLGRGKEHLTETERRFSLKHRWRWVQAA
jgi:hypothetical protein